MKISMLGTTAAVAHLVFVTSVMAASAPSSPRKTALTLRRSTSGISPPSTAAGLSGSLRTTDIGAKMDAFSARRGTLKDGPAAVLGAYRAFDEIGMLQYKVYRYPQLQRDVDTRNQDVAGKFQRVGAVFARFGTSTSWFTPELLKIPQATMEQRIYYTPALAPYRFTILDNYRQQLHVLDEQGEARRPWPRVSIRLPRLRFRNSPRRISSFPSWPCQTARSKPLPGSYQFVLQTNYNQADRAKAFEAFLGTYAATANTYAAIYG